MNITLRIVGAGPAAFQLNGIDSHLPVADLLAFLMHKRRMQEEGEGRGEGGAAMVMRGHHGGGTASSVRVSPYFSHRVSILNDRGVVQHHLDDVLRRGDDSSSRAPSVVGDVFGFLYQSCASTSLYPRHHDHAPSVSSVAWVYFRDVPLSITAYCRGLQCLMPQGHGGGGLTTRDHTVVVTAGAAGNGSPATGLAAVEGGAPLSLLAYTVSDLQRAIFAKLLMVRLPSSYSSSSLAATPFQLSHPSELLINTQTQRSGGGGAHSPSSSSILFSLLRESGRGEVSVMQHEGVTVHVKFVLPTVAEDDDNGGGHDASGLAKRPRQHTCAIPRVPLHADLGFVADRLAKLLQKGGPATASSSFFSASSALLRRGSDGHAAAASLTALPALYVDGDMYATVPSSAVSGAEEEEEAVVMRRMTVERYQREPLPMAAASSSSSSGPLVICVGDIVTSDGTRVYLTNVPSPIPSDRYMLYPGSGQHQRTTQHRDPHVHDGPYAATNAANRSYHTMTHASRAIAAAVMSRRRPISYANHHGAANAVSASGVDDRSTMLAALEAPRRVKERAMVRGGTVGVGSNEHVGHSHGDYNDHQQGVRYDAPPQPLTNGDQRDGTKGAATVDTVSAVSSVVHSTAAPSSRRDSEAAAEEAQVLRGGGVVRGGSVRGPPPVARPLSAGPSRRGDAPLLQTQASASAPIASQRSRSNSSAAPNHCSYPPPPSPTKLASATAFGTIPSLAVGLSSRSRRGSELLLGEEEAAVVVSAPEPAVLLGERGSRGPSTSALPSRSGSRSAVNQMGYVEQHHHLHAPSSSSSRGRQSEVRSNSSAFPSTTSPPSPNQGDVRQQTHSRSASGAEGRSGRSHQSYHPHGHDDRAHLSVAAAAADASVNQSAASSTSYAPSNMSMREYSPNPMLQQHGEGEGERRSSSAMSQLRHGSHSHGGGGSDAEYYRRHAHGSQQQQQHRPNASVAGPTMSPMSRPPTTVKVTLETVSTKSPTLSTNVTVLSSEVIDITLPDDGGGDGCSVPPFTVRELKEFIISNVLSRPPPLPPSSSSREPPPPSLNQLHMRYGHRTLYDEETLAGLLPMMAPAAGRMGNANQQHQQQAMMQRRAPSESAMILLSCRYYADV